MALRAILWCAVSTKSQAADEKASLPAQETDQRAVCDHEGMDVVDVLLVPGHSRNYIDFHELAADAARSGIHAFARLEQHWQDCDFDVLLVRDGDRFARTQSLHAFITEMTIYEAGAVIYSLADGWIDETNAPMWIAMAGYKAANDNRERVKKYQIGMDRRAARGLPVSPHVPPTHKLIRDPATGKGQALIVDEDKRRFFDDLATLFLEGVPFARLETELYQRCGHANDKGTAYHRHYCYWLLMSPVTWGHTARHHRPSANRKRIGEWVFDEHIPPPEEVQIWRNTVQPVYTGEQADAIKAELRRRIYAIKGSAKPHTTNRFTGLVICAACGYRMSTTYQYGNYRAMYCATSTGHPGHRGRSVARCTNTTFIHERIIQAWLDQKLREAIASGFLDMARAAEQPQQSAAQRVELLNSEIADLDTQARRLVREQANAPDEMQPYYREEIESLSERLRILRSNVASLHYDAAQEQHENTLSQRTLQELAELTVDEFWKQDSRTINQTLHRLLGRNTMVVRGREIVGYYPMQGKRRK